MAQVITLGNFKGGVGKTANSTMIALELSKKGYKTLLVDLDPQGNATNIYLKTRANLTNNIVHFKTTLMASIEDGDLSTSLINIKDNLDLLASSSDFALYPRYMEKYKDYTQRVREFSNLLQSLKEQYDYILIDTPPTAGLITDSALYASDYCIIVMQTQELSLQGAEAFIKNVQEYIIDEYKAPRLEIVGVLAVLMQPNAPVDDATLQNAVQEFGEDNIFKEKVHSMQRLKRYTITGITFNTRFDKKVFAVYDNITNELIHRIEAIENE